MKFVIQGLPIVQARPGQGKYGQRYDPNGKAKKALGMALLASRVAAKNAILGGEIRMRLTFYGIQKGDLDNAIKAFSDAANKVLWKDDRQVVEIEAKMIRIDANPRTEVEITEVPV